MPSLPRRCHSPEHTRWYANTARAFQRIDNLMDPFPQERRRAKTYTEIQDILRTHDFQLEEKRKARLDEEAAVDEMRTLKPGPVDVSCRTKRL